MGGISGRGEMEYADGRLPLERGSITAEPFYAGHQRPTISQPYPTLIFWMKKALKYIGQRWIFHGVNAPLRSPSRFYTKAARSAS